MTGQEKSPAGGASTWEQNTWRNKHRAHAGFEAIELQVKPEDPQLTNTGLSPSPKTTGTSVRLAPRGHPAVLYPGPQQDKFARGEEGYFAQSCPSQNSVQDYRLRSPV